MLKSKKISTTFLTRKLAPNNYHKSRVAITTTMMMMTIMTILVLATSASIVAPAQAQTLPPLDRIIIPKPNGDTGGGDGGTLVASVNECFANIPPQNHIALTNCIKAAIFDDDPPIPPSDPCEIVPEFC